MIETHEYGGLWWLPEEDANKISGTLTIVRGRATLSVLGSFGNNVISSSSTQTVYSPEPAPAPRILGLTTGGKAVTLEGCIYETFSMNFPGIPTTTYRARIVFFDVWFEADEQIELDEIAIRTTELDTWVGISPFQLETKLDELPETGHATLAALNVHFEPTQAVVIPLDHGNESRIEFSFTQSGMRPVTTELTVSQSAQLHLRFGARKPINEALAAVGYLRNFLSLAVGRPVTAGDHQAGDSGQMQLRRIRRDLLPGDRHRLSRAARRRTRPDSNTGAARPLRTRASPSSR